MIGTRTHVVVKHYPDGNTNLFARTHKGKIVTSKAWEGLQPLDTTEALDRLLFEAGLVERDTQWDDGDDPVRRGWSCFAYFPTRTMSGEMFRALRESLGLTPKDLADMLNVARRTPERWESDDSPIPQFAVDALRSMESRASNDVQGLVSELSDSKDPMFVIRDGADRMPARWHRAIAARVRWELPALQIVAGPSLSDAAVAGPVPEEDCLSFAVGSGGKPAMFGGLDAPHLLVIGAPGTGKTTTLDAIAAQALAARWDVRRANHLLADLHSHAVSVVSAIHRVMVERRTDLDGKPMNPILLTVDDLDTLLNDPSSPSRDEFVRHLIEIAQQGRGVRVHLAVATGPMTPPDDLQESFDRDFARLAMGYITPAERQRQAAQQPVPGALPYGVGRGLFELTTGANRLVTVTLAE